MKFIVRFIAVFAISFSFSAYKTFDPSRISYQPANSKLSANDAYARKRATKLKSGTVRRVIVRFKANKRVSKRLKNGIVLDLAGLKPGTFKIKALTSPRKLGSVVFNFDDGTDNQLLNRRPYQINVGESGDVSWLSPGSHSLTVTPFSGAKAEGEPGARQEYNFEISGLEGEETTSDDENGDVDLGSSKLSALWANDGGDKVTRDELRASSGQNIANSIWNGSRVSLFGAKNEVVSFNLVLEAASSSVSDLSLTFDELSGPLGFKINSASTGSQDIFNYTQKNIELFFVRYLEIKGLSALSYDTYDERHIPKRMRRPFSGQGFGQGGWNDRPDHNKFYPEIAVPLEIAGKFSITKGRNQSIWADIFVPRNAPAGSYSGELEVREQNIATLRLPVELVVRNFTLPDTPSAKTMVFLGYSDINQRYLGQAYPDGSAVQNQIDLIRNRHFQMAHRHKIDLIDGNDGATAAPSDQPRPEWLPRLNGQLFTAAQGYAGPGEGVGNQVFSIGTYGSWNWQSQGQAAMQQHANNWASWFEQNAPQTEYFLYLIDESSNYAQINTWASWINSNPGIGNKMKSFATLNLPAAVNNTPALDIAAGWMTVGTTSAWQSAVNTLNNTSGKEPYLYNGTRPSSGSFAIEDDGVALRELAWGQHKKGIKRWFFWQGVYYDNYQGGQGQTNVFSDAQTFGAHNGFDSVRGQSGWNFSNGDGVLFYPGTDRIFPGESYGVSGPLASLRLKYWRRGIQDVDYLKLAAQKNSQAVSSIVSQMIPKVLWEHGVDDPNDPTWVRTDISWPTDPDAWEAARRQLADIIEN